MRKCAIMQPTYLPWVGLFNLLAKSDVFIFLDDVQYSKNSFDSRNCYPSATEQKPQWLTVPVRREKLAQTFKETKFVDDKWRKKHSATIHHTYRKHEFYEQVRPYIIGPIEDTSLDNLADLNVKLIRNICEYLGVQKEFYRSSELSVSGERSERIVALNREFNCDVYLSPKGAFEYIVEDGLLLNSMEVLFQDFECFEYPQRGIQRFIPYCSMMDLIFNVAPEKCVGLISTTGNFVKRTP